MTPISLRIFVIALWLFGSATCIAMQDAKPDEQNNPHTIVFSENTKNRSQEIELPSLHPGKTNRVFFKSINHTGESLNFDKVTVSCGCMVVKGFNSKLPVGGHSDLQLDVKVGTGKTERREIRFDSSNGSYWNLVILLRPIPIFNEGHHVFELGREEVDANRSVKLQFNELAIRSGLVSTTTPDLRCHSNQLIVQDASVSRSDDGVEIKVVPDWNRFGLKKSLTENIEIEGPHFRHVVPVVFRNKSKVRISPSTCSPQRISDGQRFIVMKDPDVSDLSFRGVFGKGEKFPLAIDERSELGSGEIIEFACKLSDLDSCEKIEVFETSKPELVLSWILLETPN